MSQSSHRRVLEFVAVIKSMFEPAVLTHLRPRSQVDLFNQVLQQDDDLLSASMNATMVAHITIGIAPSDFVCAVSSGIHSTQPLLGLATLEENDFPHLTATLMPRTEKVPLVTLETYIYADRFEENLLPCVQGGQGCPRDDVPHRSYHGRGK